MFQSTNFIHNIFCARYDIGNKEKKLERWTCFFKKEKGKEIGRRNLREETKRVIGGMVLSVKEWRGDSTR